MLDPRLVELSEEPRWVESNASRVENGIRTHVLGVPETLLAALRRTLVEPWPSQPLGKRRGVCGLQRIAHPPADTPVAQLAILDASPVPPKLLKTALLHYSWYQELFFFTTPHASRGRRILVPSLVLKTQNEPEDALRGHHR